MERLKESIAADYREVASTEEGVKSLEHATDFLQSVFELQHIWIAKFFKYAILLSSHWTLSLVY